MGARSARRLWMFGGLCAIALLVLSGVGRNEGLDTLTSGPTYEPVAPQRISAFAEAKPPQHLHAFEKFKGRPRAAFKDWLARWELADPAEKPSLHAEGVALAAARRAAMKALIREDPETAIREAVPYSVRKRLPPEIVALLEEPISVVATYKVGIACALDEGQEGFDVRVVSTEERRWEAYTYGRRLDVTSKYRLSAIGVAIDDHLALSDEPIRVLPPDEVAARGLDPSQIWAESMGELRGYADRNALARWADALREAEASVDPAASPDLSGGGSSSSSSNGDAPSSFTSGSKSVLYIICDFPNLTGFPANVSTISNVMNVFTSYYYEASYGQLQLRVTIIPDVVRLPQNGQYYTNRFENLLDDARAGALAKGYFPWLYDYFIVLTGESTNPANYFDFPYSGMAWVGAPGVHLVAPYYTLRTVGHEFGHNLGLFHANYWRTDCESPIGRDSVPGGYVGDSINDEWVEYAHRFSLMSAQISPDMDDRTAHFAPREKLRVGWIASNRVAILSTSATIRLFRHDHIAATQGIAAIHINRASGDYTGNGREYWLSYRRAYTTNEWLVHGVQVDWVRPTYGQDGVVQLDMTPYSNDGQHSYPFLADNLDKWDGALVIGRTYSDEAAGIHITPLAIGGSAPNHWIDVRVHIGNDPSNRPPVLTLDVPATNAAVGGDLAFIASASDPDGDDVAYEWDFDQPSRLFTQTLNRAAVTNRWNAAGEYRVRVTASDMKGGRASTSIVVRIGSPNTFRITGRVFSNGAPLQGVRVYTSPTNWTRTTSDGRYELVNLRTGAYAVRAQRIGSSFEPAFDNPLSVGPSRYGMDLGLSGPPGIAIETPILSLREGASTSYVIRLFSRPATNVIVWIQPDLPLTNAPAFAEITPYTWVGGVTVAVSAANDRLPGLPVRTSFIEHVASSSDPNIHARAASLSVMVEEANAVDTDLDGLPDSFELAYFGSLSATTASEDPDEDGLTNLEEYVAGTDPTDPSSFMRTVFDEGEILRIALHTATGRVYTLYSAPALNDQTIWTAVPGAENLPGTGGILWLDLPRSDAAYFRVETQLAP